MREPESFRARVGGSLGRERTTTVQVNVGKLCNQACTHCHVDASPLRTEQMSASTADRLLELLQRSPQIETLDLTGGAPELNPEFRRLVRSARALGVQVIDRCNLTVLCEPGQEDTPRFLADHAVHVIASLPCYSRQNVDKQRGKGVFSQSIQGLQRLNQAGYGGPDGLRLDLVYNPIGPTLPPPQAQLADDYRARLFEDFGIRFTDLYTLTNMPLARFRKQLERRGQLDAYLELLQGAYNADTVPGLMCRSMVSVSWDGRLYDCDFNQMLELPCPTPYATLWDIEAFGAVDEQPIALATHCFGCTAGAGSSCGGALVG